MLMLTSLFDKYVITDIADADQFLIKNYDTKGDLSKDIAE